MHNIRLMNCQVETDNVGVVAVNEDGSGEDVSGGEKEDGDAFDKGKGRGGSGGGEQKMEERQECGVTMKECCPSRTVRFDVANAVCSDGHADADGKSTACDIFPN